VLTILRTKKGMSMVEVFIAMFITTVAVVSIFSMIPMSWKTAGKSDYLSRATGLLQDELEWRQYQTERGIDPTTLEYPAGGQAILVGNATFTVTTTTSKVNATTWLVNVNVTWPGTNNGITSSMLVTRQNGFYNPDNS
jgi:Tfp pilus assembly protein PilV